MNIGASIIQATNLVLLIANTGADMRKCVIWQKDGDKLTEVLSGLQIARIAIEDSAKLFEHPIETGGVITDHEIFDPNRAVLQAYISNDDAETLTELEKLYKSGANLRIRACNKIIQNVVISSKPFEVTSDIFDKTLYSISLQEYYEVVPAYVSMPPAKVTNKANASRVNKGVKQAAASTNNTNRSWLSSLFFGGRT